MKPGFSFLNRTLRPLFGDRYKAAKFAASLTLRPDSETTGRRSWALVRGLRKDAQKGAAECGCSVAPLVSLATRGPREKQTKTISREATTNP
jgi:hypothetical protein